MLQNFTHWARQLCTPWAASAPSPAWAQPIDKPSACSPRAQGQAALDAMHQGPLGFDRRQARRIQNHFLQACRADPHDALAQAGLLQILRETAIHRPSACVMRDFGRTACGAALLAQCAIVLRTQACAEIEALLGQADDLWGILQTPKTEAVMRRDILPALGALLSDAHTPSPLARATLTAFDRIACAQPWSAPLVMVELARWQTVQNLDASVLLYSAPVLRRIVLGPLNLTPDVVTFVRPMVTAHQGNSDALVAACQIARAALLPAAQAMAPEQAALSLVVTCGAQLPGEASSFEAVRLLLDVAEAYEALTAPGAGAFCVAAIAAIGPLVSGAMDHPSGGAVVRSIAERALGRLEHAATPEVARAAATQLAQMTGPARGARGRRVSALRVP